MGTGFKRLPARFYRTDSGREPYGNGLRAWMPVTAGSSARISKCWAFMAHRYAARSSPGQRTVGSSKQPAARPHCSRSVLRGARVHGASAWIYEEDAEDAEGG